MIDLLYLAKGRPEFTGVSFRTLMENTDGARFNVHVYSDMEDSQFRVPGFFHTDVRTIGGPVDVMKHYLSVSKADLFAKIDNDVIVPPGWLERCLAVMAAFPELDLLGIEPPSSTIKVDLRMVYAPGFGEKSGPGYSPCDSIGGIGMMRRRAFVGRAPMVPHSTFGGFTDWQLAHRDVVKGWIAPPLKLFLLDRLQLEPWASLSKRYIAEGQQRPWKNYTAEDSHLWEWWLPFSGRDPRGDKRPASVGDSVLSAVPVVGN